MKAPPHDGTPRSCSVTSIVSPKAEHAVPPDRGDVQGPLAGPRAVRRVRVRLYSKPSPHRVLLIRRGRRRPDRWRRRPRRRRGLLAVELEGHVELCFGCVASAAACVRSALCGRVRRCGCTAVSGPWERPELRRARQSSGYSTRAAGWVCQPPGLAQNGFLASAELCCDPGGL